MVVGGDGGGSGNGDVGGRIEMSVVLFLEDAQLKCAAASLRAAYSTLVVVSLRDEAGGEATATKAAMGGAAATVDAAFFAAAAAFSAVAVAAAVSWRDRSCRRR